MVKMECVGKYKSTSVITKYYIKPEFLLSAFPFGSVHLNPMHNNWNHNNNSLLFNACRF